MGKDLEIKGDEEVIEARLSIARMKQPYQTASRKDWEGFKEFYESNPDSLFDHVTITKEYAFHIAASTENTQLLRDLLGMIPTSKIQEALTQLKDEHGNTALHEVATTDNVDAAKFLVNMLWKSIHETDQIIEDNEIDPSCKLDQFLKVNNNLGETPLYRAAALGNGKMVKYLVGEIEKVGGTITSHFYRYDTISIFHIAVLAQHFGIAIWLLNRQKQLGEETDINGLTGFQMLASMPSAFRSTNEMSILKKLIYYCLLNDYDDDEALADQLPSSQGEDVETGMRNRQPKKRGAISRMYFAITSRMYFAICNCLKGWEAINTIWKEKNKHESALRLVKLLAKQDLSWTHSYKAEEDSTISLGLGKGADKGPPNSKEGSKATKSEKSETLLEIPLLLAAREGIVEIFDEILNEYPQAIDHVSENGHNVLHLAIIHRQNKIFERIKKKEMSVQKLASKIDNNGNTILHQAAETKHYEGGKRPGPAFQLQEELHWFQNAQKLMPPHYVMHRNKGKITAQDLFKESHNGQYTEAKGWIQESSESCSTVAVLVATVVFAAAYTVPGGSNDQGLPNFLHSPFFLLFTVMDVVALASSLTSVVMFLSVLTSPNEQNDYLYSLPRKLTFGFTFLFISVITTMITFTASLLLIIRLKKRLTSILMYTAAFIPIAVFAILQYPLYVVFLNIMMEFFKEFLKALPGKKKKKKY